VGAYEARQNHQGHQTNEEDLRRSLNCQRGFESSVGVSFPSASCCGTRSQEIWEEGLGFAVLRNAMHFATTHCEPFEHTTTNARAQVLLFFAELECDFGCIALPDDEARRNPPSTHARHVRQPSTERVDA
jgi:hypothetical protein